MRMTEYGVNVPDDLLTQLEEENVVLFLGAGISKLAPSNLPDFTKLTKVICKETGVRFSNKLSLDYNLSKVVKAGYDVHQLVREKIDPLSSKPNEWHETLLQWFGSENHVRIVTTNFDPHLSTSAKNLNWTVPEYVAPALPLGDKFQGIVYLHGRIDDKESIVVTGEDFGKAYLNYAWAARFLQAMFANYTVVFIGYSNRDPLVRYLTSGLSVCSNKHYAFTGNDVRREWDELDIEPILFEQTNDEKFEAMLHVAKDIAQQYCMSELEHEGRMRDLLTTKKETLLTPQDQDYLLRSLSKVNRQRHFCRYAEGELWFKWAIKNIKEVQLLFDSFTKTEDSSREYIGWIVGSCFKNANNLLLKELAKRKLSYDLWYQISWAICYREVKFSTKQLVTWIYILLRDATLPGHWNILQEMLIDKKVPSPSHLEWTIFSQLIKPMIHFNTNIYTEKGAEERPVLASIVIRSNDPKELCEYWQTILRNRLPDIYNQVQSLVAAYLTEAYYMLIEQGGWLRELDEVSYSRETIVKKISDDGFTHIKSMDPLINAAVDLIQWYAEHHQKYLEWLIIGWNDSKIPMLQRLSLYALSLANWSADEKFQWLLHKQILQWTVFYREPYQLLGEIFVNLSPAIKEEALSALLQLVNYDPDDGELNHDRSLRTYYLVKSMTDKYGESKTLTAAVETIKTLLENAGIEYKTIDSDKETVTIDIPALLDGNIISAFQWYDEILQNNDFLNKNSYKEKFEIAFREKAAKELSWAISIADILWQQDNKNAHYLSRILLGILGDVELTHELQELLFKKIQNIVILEHLGNSVAFFLKSRSKKGFDEYAQQVVDELINCVDYTLAWAVTVPFEKDPSRRWLESAINHPVSDLTLVLLEVLSSQGKDEKYIIGVTERLSKLLDDNRNIAQITEVICASQAHFLYEMAPDWAITKVLPLFDWNKSIEQAERAWDGFLFWGRISRKLIAPLLRHFIMSVDFLERIDGERYCEYLAWLTLSRYIEKPLAVKALGNVILKLNEEQKASYFSYIRLSGIQNKRYSDWIWNDVLLPLLDVRSRMIVELTAGELFAILRWVVEFTDYSDSIIEKLIKFSTAKIKECYQLNHFERADICEKYPEDVAKLWIWIANSLMPGQSSNVIYGKIAERILLNGEVSEKLKQQISEALSGLGLEVMKLKD